MDNLTPAQPIHIRSPQDKIVIGAGQKTFETRPPPDGQPPIVVSCRISNFCFGAQTTIVYQYFFLRWAQPNSCN